MAAFEKDLLFRVIGAEVGIRKPYPRRFIETPLIITFLTQGALRYAGIIHQKEDRSCSLLMHEIWAKGA